VANFFVTMSSDFALLVVALGLQVVESGIFRQVIALHFSAKEPLSFVTAAFVLPTIVTAA
jgi:hypothetical protein